MSKIHQQGYQKKAPDVSKPVVEFAATCNYFGAEINSLVQRVKKQNMGHVTCFNYSSVADSRYVFGKFYFVKLDAITSKWF